MENEEIDNRTRAQKAKEIHQKANRERLDAINKLKISYKKIKNEPAFLDLLGKAKSFAAYHEKIGRDGVGYRATGEKDSSGNDKMILVDFAGEKRLFEFERNAGIQEVVDYIERQISAEGLKPIEPKKVVAE